MAVNKPEFNRDYYRDNLVRQMNSKKNLLIETDRAVVMVALYPKAQYHFIVVAKEDIKNVTELTADHLPLLDHMLQLANQIMKQKAEHLSTSNFRLGFKTHAFMNRLNLHVASEDFYSYSMRRINHWNSFNTDLFLPFQAAYLMIQMQGCIDPMTDERAEELKYMKPLHCNQCDFFTDILLQLKQHLYDHWLKRERDLEHKRQVKKVLNMLESVKLEKEQESATAAVKPYEKALPLEGRHEPKLNKYQEQGQQQAQQGYNNYIQAPPINVISQQYHQQQLLLQQKQSVPFNPFRQKPVNQARPNGHFNQGSSQRPNQRPGYKPNYNHNQRAGDPAINYQQQGAIPRRPPNHPKQQRQQQTPETPNQSQPQNFNSTPMVNGNPPFVKKNWPKKQTTNRPPAVQGTGTDGAGNKPAFQGTRPSGPGKKPQFQRRTSGAQAAPVNQAKPPLNS